MRSSKSESSAFLIHLLTRRLTRIIPFTKVSNSIKSGHSASEIDTPHCDCLYTNISSYLLVKWALNKAIYL